MKLCDALLACRQRCTGLQASLIANYLSTAKVLLSALMGLLGLGALRQAGQMWSLDSTLSAAKALLTGFTC